MTTDLDSVLGDPDYQIYFDAADHRRAGPRARKAMAAGKHVYCEKPTAGHQDGAELAATKAGVKNGVVQDKLWLPGMMKLRRLKEKASSARSSRCAASSATGCSRATPAGPAAVLELPQGRRRRDHRRHALPLALRAGQPVRQRQGGSCLGATHIPERIDEQGKRYKADADDAAYATFELEGGVIAHFNSSW